MVNKPDTWELTWHNSRPAGRATFRRVRVGDEWAIHWLQIGYYDIYKRR